MKILAIILVFLSLEAAQNKSVPPKFKRPDSPRPQQSKMEKGWPVRDSAAYRTFCLSAIREQVKRKKKYNQTQSKK